MPSPKSVTQWEQEKCAIERMTGLIGDDTLTQAMQTMQAGELAKTSKQMSASHAALARKITFRLVCVPIHWDTSRKMCSKPQEETGSGFRPMEHPSSQLSHGRKTGRKQKKTKGSGGASQSTSRKAKMESLEIFPNVDFETQSLERKKELNALDLCFWQHRWQNIVN